MMPDNDLPTECCAKCRFAIGMDEGRYVCRRYPPSASSISHRQDRLWSWVEGWNHPEVQDLDWCGEFQPVSPAVPPVEPKEQPQAKYPLLRDIRFHLRARKALQHLVPKKTGVPWDECTIDMLSEFSRDDLGSFKGCGGTTIEEIREQCLKYDLFLRGDEPPLPDEKRTLRELGSNLSVAALHMLEKHFRDVGTPEVIDACSMRDLMLVHPDWLNPPHSRSGRIGDEFRTWRRNYYYSKHLAAPERD